MVENRKSTTFSGLILQQSILVAVFYAIDRYFKKIIAIGFLHNFEICKKDCLPNGEQPFLQSHRSLINGLY
jgi:hypothetical protein